VGARPGQDEDRAVAQYHHAATVLAEAGYRGYEISNWARPGHESRHNLAYWQRLPVEGVGPGAHAFDGQSRRWNAAGLDAYLAALATGHSPPGDVIATDPDAAASEAVILALRLDDGIPLAAASEPPLADHFGWALAAELLDVTVDRRVVLTTRGRLLSNELFARLV
jgi:oxygen-independent coproporphyrinogen-3 oxidase